MPKRPKEAALAQHAASSSDTLASTIRDEPSAGHKCSSFCTRRASVAASRAGDEMSGRRADPRWMWWDDGPGWPAFRLDTRPAMVFDGESTLVSDPLRLQRSLWRAA